MNYPQLKDKYEEWLDNHSLDDIDSIFIIDELILSLTWEQIHNDVVSAYIISDLFQLDRYRKLHKLNETRLKRMQNTNRSIVIKYIKK